MTETDKQIDGDTCGLCGRPLIAGPSVNEHHLVPRSHRGRDKVRMHRICHNKIHSVFSERELASFYHTWPRLLAHPEIAVFVDWVRKKPSEYFDKNRPPRRRA